MTSHSSRINGGMLISRNELSMPKWVKEQSDRVGPKPPPPPITPENVPPKKANQPPKIKQPEPDYEVIEFSNQQYSNTPLRPNSASSGSKTPDNKLKCTLCGSNNPWVTCDECAQQLFCASCDDMFHKHPKRKNHQRKTIEKTRPPLPPKVLPGQPGPTPPVAPPRRGKRGLMTPIMQRKDQIQGNAKPGPFPEPTSPTLSTKNSSWHDRIGSLPRGLNFLNRPLPETPKTPSESSRSTTPKSVFDNIQRPPSVALEKIKSKANATLDRMQLLQQRYRQQKEQMERDRSGSATDQNMSAFDQWSNISLSPSHFRSGSMSSGINSSHLDLMDDTNFNLFHQRQMALQHHQMAEQRANQLGQRGISSSVFNLSQINRKQPAANNSWMNSSMQQAQSMAQLNCGNCAQHQFEWNGQSRHNLSSQQHLNQSNMSLNVPAGYMLQSQLNNMYPPPTFMNQRSLMPHMYPQPYMGGMPVMNTGLICMPPSNSRAASRAGSRMASPAMSRKSLTLRRKQRSSYIDDEATDDEDSDEDDRRSIISTRSVASRSRQRRISSASQFQVDNEIESTQAKLQRNRVRSQRRDSIAKSVHNDWTPGKKASSNNSNNRSVDSGFNSPLKPSRIYSDLDSEGSGTRALVQAKIEQKLKEESLKQKHVKPKRQSKSPPPKKASAAVQTPAMKHTKNSEEVKKSVNEIFKQGKKSLDGDLEKNDQGSKSKEERPQVTEEERRDESENTIESESESMSELCKRPTTNKENEEIEQIEENGVEVNNLGPPPSTPDHEWECEFCTFVNEANIKICSICCKTPSIKPKKTTTRNQEVNQVKLESDTIRKTPLKSSQPSPNQHNATNDIKVPKTTDNFQKNITESAQNTDDHNDFTTDTLNNKESVEDIWASLDENIQATAQEVTFKAHSQKTSRATFAPKSTSVEPHENNSRQSEAREIGTSPPPQSISTQTYDTLPTHKTQTRDESVPIPTPQPLYNDVIQIQDLKSFEAEVLNKIHNISHVPSHYQNHHANYPIHSYNDRQRYRSNNDLRMDDSVPADFEAFNGLGKRQPSISELMLFQKTSSQTQSPFGGSAYELPYRELSSLRSNDVENHKESDLYKHTTEELNAAIKYCGPDMHPLVWLRDNWPKLIQTVQSLATKYGQERAENTIGTISQVEAREALRMHTGNIWQAVSECIEQRQKKYREISSKGNFSREDIVTALTIHQGNVDSALLDLGRTQLKPFLMRIWGSPGGVENESGSQPLLTTTPPPKLFNMDKDIHSFLSANASDCMQTPKDTGANLNNIQTPSPFDRPVSLKSPFDNSNHVPDNASSCTSDGKIVAGSSLPLDESILGNKNVLKDLETLIGNMENNQQKQNEYVPRSIHDTITNIIPKTETEYDPEPMRILTKSPILSPKLNNSSSSTNETDVKNFVWQHIQEIMPNFVQQVELELVEDIKNNDPSKESSPVFNQIASAPPPPPIDQDEFLMEEVIKPNIKNASIREEQLPQYVYTAEIATFQMVFDRGLEREHEEDFELESLEKASRKIYKMLVAPTAQTLQQDSIFIGHTKSTALEMDSQETETPSTTKISNSVEETSKLKIVPSNEESFPPSMKINVEKEYNDKSILPLRHSPPRALILLTDMMKGKRIEGENTASEINSDATNPNPVNKFSIQVQKLPNSSQNKSFRQEPIAFSAENRICNQSILPTPSTSAESVKAKHDNVAPSVERHKPNKQSMIRAKNISECKQTTTKDLSEELGKTEAATTINETDRQDAPYHILPEESRYVKASTFPVSAHSQSLNSASHLEKAQGNNLISQQAELNDGDGIANLTSEGVPVTKTKSLTNITLTSSTNKRISKIPIRRTASNKNLINSSTKILRNYLKDDIKTQEPNSDTTAIDSKTQQPESLLLDDELNNDEPYSIESSKSSSEIVSRADRSQSPSTTTEMFLVIQQETSETASTIAPSTSDSTLHSTISQSSSFKSPTEFVPSGDPSKQNLTELVKDTQRLIQQMKDEISIDDFESSTDDDEYSDEFSDEYDDGEEEEEEYWDENEDEEYDDVTEEITEENAILSIQTESFSKTHSPLPSQEFQDHRATYNSSPLSNTTGSSIHSLALSNDHFEQEYPVITYQNDTQSQNILADEPNANVKTEKNFPQLSVEISVNNNLEKLKNSVQYVELENSVPELPVEIVLPHAIIQDDKLMITQNHSSTQKDSKEQTSMARGSTDILLASTLKSNELAPENDTLELAAEVVIGDVPIENIKDKFNLKPEERQDSQNIKKPEQPQNYITDLNNQKILQKSEANPTDLNEANSSKTSDHLRPTNVGDKSVFAAPNTVTKEATKLQQLESESMSLNQESNLIQISQTDSTTTQDIISATNTANPIDITSISHNTSSDNLSSSSKTFKSSPAKGKLNEPVKTPVKKSPATSKIPKPKEVPKEQKQKEVPATNSKTDLKRKSYTRSKSFSGPPTPIGIASVKTISQKFISPSPSNPKPMTTKNHTTVARKSSITDTINKFGKSSASSEKPAVNLLFKPRTQPRIPKKKYHETCFSDDNFESSSDEEEMEPLEIRERKLSVPVFKTYPNLQEPEKVNTEELVEKFMKEELAATVAEAQIAAALVSMKFQQDVSLWAAKECSDLDHAIALLKQECELCSGTYALNQIVSMLKCTHKCCKQCAKTYFTVQITERNINDCSCPFCKLPELHNQIEHEDECLEYFSNLDILLKSILEPEVHELFQRKLRDRTLLKDPNFKWCVQCSSGFFARPKQKRFICPDCGSITCAQCRKTWQKQHEGISCDQFSKWESANDPEVQAKGVQQHLEQNGIECPKCKFKYSLARGGCMHFTCTQCKYEFCYGCAKPFMMGAKCTISPYCAKLGLHAHHPRNCLFYLRDKLPVQLQILLKNNDVTFEVDPIEVSGSDNDNQPSSSKKKEALCLIPIQKETPTGLVDTICNGDVPEKHAGMCRNHYVEYLTAKVAKAKIDPLPIFDLTDCVQELRRRGIALPERGPWDTDEIYKNMCAEVIQKNIPLDMD